jgi:hypothetical protein
MTTSETMLLCTYKQMTRILLKGFPWSHALRTVCRPALLRYGIAYSQLGRTLTGLRQVSTGESVGVPWQVRSTPGTTGDLQRAVFRTDDRSLPSGPGRRISSIWSGRSVAREGFLPSTTLTGSPDELPQALAIESSSSKNVTQLTESRTFASDSPNR